MIKDGHLERQEDLEKSAILDIVCVVLTAHPRHHPYAVRNTLCTRRIKEGKHAVLSADDWGGGDLEAKSESKSFSLN